MLFSFFVAVMMTPWLMLKIAAGGVSGADRRALRTVRPSTAARSGAPTGCSPGCWSARACAPGSCCWRSASLTIGSLALFYTRDVTVKLLAVRQQGRAVRWWSTCRKAHRSKTRMPGRFRRWRREACSGVPEVHSCTDPCRDGLAVQFQRAGASLRTCAPCPSRATWQLNLTPKQDRERSSHEIALDLRAQIAAIPLPDGASLKVVEPPPGPPVMATLLAEIYGPDAQTRRAGRRTGGRSLPVGGLHCRCRQFLGAARRPRPGDGFHRCTGVFPGRGARRVRHNRHSQFRPDGGILPPRWRRGHRLP
jgi:hypothetical protein